MQLDEWHMFQITPFNREIQNIKLSPPLISQPAADSFPPGEAKGQLRKPVSFTQPLSPISWQGKRFGVQYVTGRVREPTYWYAVRSVSKKARWTQMGTGVQRAFYVYDYSAEIR